MQNNPGVIVPGMPEKHVMGEFDLLLSLVSVLTPSTDDD